MLLKICGLRRLDDIFCVNQNRPDYAGFVFAKSRRQVSALEAKKLISTLDPAIKSVGVFVNEEMEKLVSIVKTTGIEVVQLHGDEDEAYFKRLREQLPREIAIWKAVRVKNKESFLKARLILADAFLLDAYAPSAYGGTGKTADWELILENPLPGPVFLAGGIRLENVERAISAVKPAGIDVSGGVEKNGVKDSKMMQGFVKKVKGRA